jgi:outer membrane protein assembly factor BamB
MDCLTQHYDAARTGWNSNETTLTPATVGSPNFSLAFTQEVDGQIYAQPLYVGGLDLPSFGVRNVVFVATEAGSVYAFDADVPDPVTPGTPGPYWKQSLVPTGERPFNTVTDLVSHCTDLTPVVCITSTPVIDRAAGILFATAKTITKTGGVAHYRLHAMHLADGSPRQKPAGMLGSVPGTGASSSKGRITFDAKHHHNRPGLLLFGGTLYVAFASHCDHSPYYGWIFGYNASTLVRVAKFNAAPDKCLRPVTPPGLSDQAAGIWQGGIGVAADTQGFLYCQTGNGPFDLDLGGKDCGDTVLKLTPHLAVAGSFTPHNQDHLDTADLDLGSGGVMVLPDQPGSHPHQMVSCGKEGTVYLMDRASPGGFHASDQVLGILPKAILKGVWGGPAYYDGAQGQRIYYCAKDGPLRSLSLNNAHIQLLAHSADTFPFPPATPTVSSNGSAAGTGVVWATQVAGANTIRLLAFDADNVAHRVFDAPAGPYNNGPKFTVPTVADGRVFVGTDGKLAVFAHHP